MQKKGVVYRLTMIAGFGFIASQTLGEIGYYRFLKKDRDDEIKEEKEDIKKMAKFHSMTLEEQEEEREEQVKKDADAAK